MMKWKSPLPAFSHSYFWSFGALALALASGACQKKSKEAPAQAKEGRAGQAAPAKVVPQAPSAAQLRERAKAFFGELPKDMALKDKPLSEAQVKLGHVLYFDERLSKGHDVSCNTCHMLDKYGVDGKPQSSGHKGQLGARNSPTVYNAALHFVQFWDGRAKDVEEQAKGPVLNPVEMAMPDAKAVDKVLRSIPGYKKLFADAFPGQPKPVSFDNMAAAIGAFERKLVTPSPFDAFLAGDDKAISKEALAGLDLFMGQGCTICHAGPALGGQMYQKLGLLKPYPTKDTGRHEVTKKDSDKYLFKVPSLRNIAKTGPYLHDGSIASLAEMVEIMAKHQTPSGALKPEQTKKIVAFLESLTGELPAQWVKAPELPKSGKKTPRADKS